MEQHDFSIILGASCAPRLKRPLPCCMFVGGRGGGWAASYCDENRSESSYRNVYMLLSRKRAHDGNVYILLSRKRALDGNVYILLSRQRANDGPRHAASRFQACCVACAAHSTREEVCGALNSLSFPSLFLYQYSFLCVFSCVLYTML